MNNSIRIHTDVGNENKFLNFELNQDFDFIEILSLKLRQEDLYKLFCSDYGVVVGRVVVNDGFGVPNAKISIFIPINDDDKDNPLISGLYPYNNISDKNSKGSRYNLLPKDSQFDCHTPVGNLPSKREILDNDVMLEIYEKYYKFTTRTNDAGDFMLFGVPTGNWKLNVDVDLSDIGILSQKPYDFIRQGVNEKRFEDVSKFKSSNNLNDLSQISHTETSVNVQPFWGDNDNCDVGLNRIDVELSHRIEPQAFFIGSIFGDNEKNSVNKNCGIRRGLGNLCETISNEGTVEMIRQTIDGEIEEFSVNGGRVIDENGSWAYQVPMNLDYVITNEYGDLIPTEDTKKGIPTRARVRFKIGMDITGEEGRTRRRAKYLVPNSDGNGNYNFNEETPDVHFRNLYWNKIYTVKQFIPRFQPVCVNNLCGTNRRFVGIKDVDACGDHTPFPYNRLDTNFNPLYGIMCFLIGIIANLFLLLNRFVINPLNIAINSIKLLIWDLSKLVCFLTHPTNKKKRGACRCSSLRNLFPDSCEGDCEECADAYEYEEGGESDPCGGDDNCSGCKDECKEISVTPSIDFLTLECNDTTYMPWYYDEDGEGYEAGCNGLPENSGAQSACEDVESILIDDYVNCKQVELAQNLNIYTLDFYNDWINGSLYAFLFKQKTRDEKDKFCDWDCDEFNNSTDSNNDGDPDNNCRKNWIVDTCQSVGDSYSNLIITPHGYNLAGAISRRETNEGVIKLFNDEYYYAATTHQSYPMFKTDLVLLGSINDYDVHGIPSIFNQIEVTTYNIPPINREYINSEAEEDTEENNIIGVSGIYDLLFSINCAGISTVEHNCFNLRKISEIGVGLDEYRGEDDPADGHITNRDIENREIRNTLAILNTNGIENIDNIGDNYVNNILDYNTDFGWDNPTYLDDGLGIEYYSYRGFDGGNGIPRLPLNNSYYFYFGINPGKTGLDKFYSNFIKPCASEIKNNLILTTEMTPVNEANGSDGKINLTIENGISPYSITLMNSIGEETNYASNDPSIVIDNLEGGMYYISIIDNNNNKISRNVFINSPTPPNFKFDVIDVSSNSNNDGQIIISNCYGGYSPYQIEVISPQSYTNLNYLDVQSTDTIVLSGLTSNEYTIKIIDNTGVFYEKDIIVNEPTQMDVIIEQIEAVSCHGSDGKLNIQIVGGAPPYTYETKGLTTGDIYDTLIVVGPAQTYRTMVSDSDGQQVAITKEMSEPSPIVINGEKINPTCYNINNGEININVNGGTPPYTYAWYKDGVYFSSEQNINNLSATQNGTLYKIKVIDDNECEAFTEYTLNSPTEIIVSRYSVGNNVNIGVSGGNSGNKTFKLYNSNNNYVHITESNSHTFSNVNNGEYSVEVIDNMGCTGYGSNIIINI